MLNTDHIHQFIPAQDATGNAFTILLLHGTGGDENSFIGLSERFGPGFNYLSPRGQMLENGMPCFFRRLAEGVFDQEDLMARTGLLASFIFESSKHYSFDLKKLVALGYSNGANMAASLMLGRHDVIKHAILLHAMLPFMPSELPDLHGSKVLMTAGEDDPVVPASNTSALADLFNQAGAQVELFWHQSDHDRRRNIPRKPVFE